MQKTLHIINHFHSFVARSKTCEKTRTGSISWVKVMLLDITVWRAITHMSVGVGDLKVLAVTTIFLTEKYFTFPNLRKIKNETKNDNIHQGKMVLSQVLQFLRVPHNTNTITETCLSRFYSFCHKVLTHYNCN